MFKSGGLDDSYLSPLTEEIFALLLLILSSLEVQVNLQGLKKS